MNKRSQPRNMKSKQQKPRWTVIDRFPITIYAPRIVPADSLEYIEYFLWAKLQLRHAAQAVVQNILHRESRAGRLSLAYIAKTDLEEDMSLKPRLKDRIETLRTVYESKKRATFSKKIINPDE